MAFMTLPATKQPVTMVATRFNLVSKVRESSKKNRKRNSLSDVSPITTKRRRWKKVTNNDQTNATLASTSLESSASSPPNPPTKSVLTRLTPFRKKEKPTASKQKPVPSYIDYLRSQIEHEDIVQDTSTQQNENVGVEATNSQLKCSSKRKRVTSYVDFLRSQIENDDSPKITEKRQNEISGTEARRISSVKSPSQEESKVSSRPKTTTFSYFENVSDVSSGIPILPESSTAEVRHPKRRKVLLENGKVVALAAATIVSMGAVMLNTRTGVADMVVDLLRSGVQVSSTTGDAHWTPPEECLSSMYNVLSTDMADISAPIASVGSKVASTILDHRNSLFGMAVSQVLTTWPQVSESNWPTSSSEQETKRITVTPASFPMLQNWKLSIVNVWNGGSNVIAPTESTETDQESVFGEPFGDFFNLSPPPAVLASSLTPIDSQSSAVALYDSTTNTEGSSHGKYLDELKSIMEKLMGLDWATIHTFATSQENKALTMYDVGKHCVNCSGSVLSFVISSVSLVTETFESVARPQLNNLANTAIKAFESIEPFKNVIKALASAATNIIEGIRDAFSPPQNQALLGSGAEETLGDDWNDLGAKLNRKDSMNGQGFGFGWRMGPGKIPSIRNVVTKTVRAVKSATPGNFY